MTKQPVTGGDLADAALADAALAASTSHAPDINGEHAAGRCEVCGNDYDKVLRIVHAGRTHTFDCFECAIHALAPSCAHCGCRIVGHGLEHGKEMYCCAHCGEARGVTDLKDRS